MYRNSVLLCAVALLAGCSSGSTEVKCVDGQEMSSFNEFSAKYAALYCDVRNDCEPGYFEERFGSDIEECHRFIVLQESKRATDKLCDQNCTFDIDRATECLGAMETLTCDSWENESLGEMCSRDLWVCDES